jgi:hypothetical protein
MFFLSTFFHHKIVNSNNFAKVNIKGQNVLISDVIEHTTRAVVFLD